MARSIAQISANFALLLVFTVTRSPAQTLPFKNYSTKDGLVHNEATSLYQDSRGYLWIGTIEGISRFDGASFTNYFLERDSSFAIPTTFVNTFAEDRKGNLWIGTNDIGLIKFENPPPHGQPPAHFKTYTTADHRKCWGWNGYSRYR